MAATDLTTIAAVKAYLAITASTFDALLQSLITQVSGAMRTDVSRDLVPCKAYNENLNGTGRQVLFVKNYPIVSASALSINGTPVAASPQPATTARQQGYLFDNDHFELIGYCFACGTKNINVQYTAGFAITGEAATIPATPFQVQTQNPQGNFNSDLGVTFSDGTPLTVGSGQGKYTVNATGQYTFNTADTGKGVLLNYGYVPADLELACLEWVALRYKQKDNAGVDSKSMAGESVHFTKDVMPDSVMLTLEQYRRVTYAT